MNLRSVGTWEKLGKGVGVEKWCKNNIHIKTLKNHITHGYSQLKIMKKTIGIEYLSMF